MSLSPVDPMLLQDAIVRAVEDVLAPVLPVEVEAILKTVLGPLVNWIVSEVTQGNDPTPKVLMLALASADAAADVAEHGKFPSEDTKP